MRRVMAPTLFALVVSALVFGWAGDAAAQRKFSFAYDQPNTTAYGLAANIFDEKLKQLSGGKLGINQFPGAQLGTEPQTLQKMRAGDIDFVITSTANASSVAPQAGVFSLHFIFRDEAHLTKALADKQVADAFRAMIKDSVQGGQVLGLMTMGFRNMYAKKEIAKVEDLKGMKVRVQATKTEDTHFPAYGAQTVHMPFGEVYTSLQTGVVNVAENGINVYEQNKHFEVAPILNITQHEANNNCIWVSDKTWNGLSDQEKRWVQEAAEDARGFLEFGRGHLVLVDGIEQKTPEAHRRLEYRLAHADLAHAAVDRLQHDVGHHPADALGGGAAEHLHSLLRQGRRIENARPHRIVDVVIDVGDDVGHASDLPFDRARAVFGIRAHGHTALPF
jgi:tripartite ATP-independent transporter DctP family solute receptor